VRRLQAAEGQRREAEQAAHLLQVVELVRGHRTVGDGDMEEAVEHVLQQLRAAPVTLGQPLGVSLEAQRGLAGQSYSRSTLRSEPFSDWKISEKVENSIGWLRPSAFDSLAPSAVTAVENAGSCPAAASGIRRSPRRRPA
jgi:hypothetical protein